MPRGDSESRLRAFQLNFKGLFVAATATPFVPADFVVPIRLVTPEFSLRMLTVDDVIKDYEAVMSSVAHLRTVWPDVTWPEGLTLRQNLIDLG